jgi:hypothetical protein
MGALPSYHTAPRVLVSRPSPSEDGVDRETTVSVTFDMPMDPATITIERFAVTGQGGGRGGSVDYDPLTKTATFTPDAPFDPGEAITVRLAGEIASLWDLAMGTECVWTFHIEEATGVADAGPGGLPDVFTLHQNYPNPFNAETTIRFSLTKAGPVKLKIFSVTGGLIRTLADSELAAGEYHAAWDGTDGLGHDLASGVYFCVLKTGETAMVRKMNLVR